MTLSNAAAAATGCLVALSQSQQGLPLGAELFQEAAPVAGGARLITLAVGRLARNKDTGEHDN